MNKIVYTSIVAFFLSLNFCFAQTTVHGGIYNNTTWSLANSPYLMDGSVVVFPGAVLTIEPGVEVRVQENGTPGSQYYLETRGTINMIGQPGALIKFRANAAVTSNYSWIGIFVKNSQGGVLNCDYISISNALYAINYDSYIPPLIILNQSEFRYNTNGLGIGLELQADSCLFYGNSNAVYGQSIFKITNCIFESNYQALPVYASDLMVKNSLFANNNVGINFSSFSTASLNVSNSTFDNNTIAFQSASNGLIDSCTFVNNIEGITYTSNLEIRNSVFNNNQTAMQVGWGTNVYDCEINNNATGVAIGPVGFNQPAPVIENNHICYNSNYNIDNRTDLNMFIPSNCFCITDSTALEGKILDGYDDITKGLISYAIYDTSCTTLLEMVNKQPSTAILENSAKPEVNIFPNPVLNDLNIPNDRQFTKAEIFELRGQLLMSSTLIDGNNHLITEALPAGTYILRLSGKGRLAEHLRFIKQ